MSLLQFIIIIAAIVFVFFGIDLYKRKKMNILHFIVFLWGGAAIIVFAFNQNILNTFGEFFGIARGADLLVYIAIIVLLYFYFELLNQFTKDKHQLTRLISQQTINETYNNEKNNILEFKNSTEKDEFVFNIRVYNEWKMVWSVIDEIIAAWFSKILLINDGSQDNSLEILQQKQKQYWNKLILIASHDINRGGGAANQTWYNFIKKHWDELKIKRFVWYDADGQMNINDMKTFIETIHREKADLYIGSRFIKWAKAENISSSRKIILSISKLVTKIFYGTNVSDPHVWYRVISLSTLRKINLTSDWMHYANELNEQIQKHKMKYIEVPININYTEYSTTKAHRQKNSNSIKLGLEMIYKKIFFR